MSNPPPSIHSLSTTKDQSTEDMEWQLLLAIDLIESTLASLDLVCLAYDQGNTTDSKTILYHMKTQLAQFLVDTFSHQSFN